MSALPSKKCRNRSESSDHADKNSTKSKGKLEYSENVLQNTVGDIIKSMNDNLLRGHQTHVGINQRFLSLPDGDTGNTTENYNMYQSLSPENKIHGYSSGSDVNIPGHIQQSLSPANKIHGYSSGSDVNIPGHIQQSLSPENEVRGYSSRPGVKVPGDNRAGMVETRKENQTPHPHDQPGRVQNNTDETQTNGAYSMSKPRYELKSCQQEHVIREAISVPDKPSVRTSLEVLSVLPSTKKEHMSTNYLTRPQRKSCGSNGQFKSTRDERVLNAKPSEEINRKCRDVNKHTNRFRKEKDDTFSVASMAKLLDCPESVGFLVAGNCSGTCFRVGDSYVMTAYHLLGPVLFMVDDKRITVDEWEKCVFVHFGYIGPFMNETTNPKFIFYSMPIYQNLEKDILVIQLKYNGIGFPAPLRVDAYDEECDSDLYLLGHPDGKPMKVDPKCRMVSLSKEDEINAQNWSLQEFQRNGYEGIGDPSMLLFHCIFEHGASGAPGFRFGPCNEPRVVTMLLKGYPSFYWEIQSDLRYKIPNNYLLEQGIKMSVIHKMMLKDQNLQNVVVNIFKYETVV